MIALVHTSSCVIITLQQVNTSPLQLALLYGQRDVVQYIVKEAKVDTAQLNEVIIYYSCMYSTNITISSVPSLCKLTVSVRHNFVETHMASLSIIYTFCCD